MMNIDKWIEDHTVLNDEIADDVKHSISVGSSYLGPEWISRDILEDLLKTHTIVPNEPTEAIIRAVTKTRYNNIISLRGQNSKEDFIEEYKSILAASQEDQE